MTGLKIAVGYLYPDIMGTYGDRGNVETIRKRCAWRGLVAEITEFRLGDRIDPATVDLLMIGGGGEAQQRLIAPDLFKLKGAAIREAAAMGAGVLAIGCGYELFGRFCQPEQGAELPGIQLFDSWTIRRTAVLSDRYHSIEQARADRAIGELVVQWEDSLLVGFENHSGGTYLGASARPLGRVVTGQGNNGDGTEGVMLGGAIGTYLRGPCLPKNPALADFLTAAALTRRYGAAELPPLADELERAARDDALRRARASRRDHGRAAARLPRQAERTGRPAPRRSPASARREIAVTDLRGTSSPDAKADTGAGR